MQYGFDNVSKIITTNNNSTPYVCSVDNKKTDGMQYDFYSGILNQPASKIDNPKEPINYCVERKEREKKILRISLDDDSENNPSFIIAKHTEVSQRKWNCPKCTYMNTIESQKCKMCNTNKPLVQPDHKQTKIILYKPQQGDSICTLASAIIGLLILDDFKFLETIDDGLLSMPIIMNAVENITADNAYDSMDLDSKFKELKHNILFGKVVNITINEVIPGYKIKQIHFMDTYEEKKDIFADKLKLVIQNIINTEMKENQMLSLILAGIGITIVRTQGMYIYIDTHGVHASSSGSKGIIIICSSIDELVSNISIDTFYLKYSLVQHGDVEQFNPVSTISYSIYDLSGQRGGYITKKQDWFKIKYM